MAMVEHDAEIVTFTDTLIQITEQLTKFETKEFKFLCSDEIASGILEEMNATDLMNLLFQRRIISAKNVDFLTECLILIGRMDIVDKLRCEESHIEELRNDLEKYNSTHLGRFRILLFHLASNITKEEVKKIKLCLDGKVTFPKAKIEKNQSGFDIFDYLIKVNFVHRSKVNNLVYLAKKLNRGDLEEQIEIYSDDQKESCGMEKNIQKESCGMMKGVMEESSNLKSESMHRQKLPEFISPSEQVMDLEKYKMTSPTRGICLIINNERFETLPLRQGTNIDKADLTRTFQILQFEIIVADNLTQVQMEQKLTEVAAMDHNKFDCFVCCILSHGGESVVFGTDEKQLSYKLLTMPFKPNNCEGLTGKPKLFFIQACQGRIAQQGTKSIGIDDWETDGVPATIIPNEADFLIACSTVSGFTSFRSKSKGSWYIRNLCKVIDENATRFDISDMMLMVNNCVSKEMGQKDNLPCVQVSAPTTTLRKKLFFF